MIVDFHIHVGRYDQLYPWVRAWGELNAPPSGLEAYLNEYITPAGLIRLLDEQGLDYGVILADDNPLSTGGASNTDVAALCADRPRLLGWGALNPFIVRDLPAALDHLLDDLGLRGVGLYPTYQHFYPNDARLYPLYARAQERGVPVMFHTGSSIFTGSRLKYGNPLLLDDVAVDFPRLPLIMAHSGRGVWYDEAFLIARLHPNTYLEISSLPPQKLLTYFPALERLAERTLFGSDWPGFPEIRTNIAAINALPLNAPARAAILGDAAARLLGLPPN